MTLASSDPFADPLINPGYLTSEFDILAMVQALKDAQYFIQASPWADFVVSPFGDLANATTDDDLALYARNFSVTVNHSIGTARMSPVGANWGVVDPDLVLKGVKGVRVVDASVFVSYLCPLHLFLCFLTATAACDPGVPHPRPDLHRSGKSVRARENCV